MKNDVQTCRCEFLAVKYSTGDLSAERMLEFERHLAVCKQCRSLVSELRLTRSLLGGVALPKRILRQVSELGRTMAAVSEVDLPRAAVSEAAHPSMRVHSGGELFSTLKQALDSICGRRDVRDSPQRSRLEAWARNWSSKAREAFDKLSAEVGDVFCPSLDVLREIGWVWAQQVQPALARTSGLTREAPGRMAKAKQARAVPAVPHGLRLRLDPVPGGNDIELIVEGLPSGADRLIALLIPNTAPARAQFALLRKAGASHGEWTARFKGVPPGSYAVAIEPLSSAGRL